MTYSGWGLEISPKLSQPPFTIETLLSKVIGYVNRLGMSVTRYCKGCDRDLPLSMFTKDKKNKDGLAFYCKNCTSEYGEKYRNTPDGVFSNIIGRSNYYKHTKPRFHKPVLLTKPEFVDWYNNQEKKCYYCDIPEENLDLIQEIFNRKMLRLEVDCMNNELGYRLDNIVLACHLCNFMKLHVFSSAEMREIAQKFIKPKWKAKLNEKRV
jgi:hypothetical protein